MRKLLPVIIICLLACSCRYDRPPEESGTEYRDPGRRPNADLEILCGGGYDAGRTITEDMVFEAYVTANDLSGNFHRTFVVEDSTGAIEVNAGFGELYNDYAPGQRVVILARGLSVIRSGGMMRLGTHINEYSPYRVEPFGSIALAGEYIFPAAEFKLITPRIKSVAELQMKDCGRLVTVVGLCAADDYAGLTWATPGGDEESPREGIRIFYDAAGDMVAVVTSGYADFAGGTVPPIAASLTGILVHDAYGPGGEECFGLKLRDLNDVAY